MRIIGNCSLARALSTNANFRLPACQCQSANVQLVARKQWIRRADDSLLLSVWRRISALLCECERNNPTAALTTCAALMRLLLFAGATGPARRSRSTATRGWLAELTQTGECLFALFARPSRSRWLSMLLANALASLSLWRKWLTFTRSRGFFIELVCLSVCRLASARGPMRPIVGSSEAGGRAHPSAHPHARAINRLLWRAQRCCAQAPSNPDAIRLSIDYHREAVRSLARLAVSKHHVQGATCEQSPANRGSP